MRVSAAGEDIANTRQRLFAAYVETLLKRRGAGAAYTPDQTRHWLSWLARGMLAHGHTVFFIENLQPDWLPEGWRRRVYLALARLMVGLTLGAAIGLAGGMAAGFPIGIAGGAAAGAGRGLGAGLTFTAFGLIVGLVGGLFGGLGMGVAVGAIDRQAASGNKINVVETLRWSPGKAFTGLLIGLAGGLVSGLIGGAAGGLANTPTTQLAIVLTIGLGVGLAGALVGGLSGREVGMRTIPNQGIWRSARNALRVGLIGALAGGLVVGVTFGSVAGASAPPNVRLLTGVGIGSSIGAAFGIAFGLGGGMLFGGLACLQHLVLRIVLACGGSLPWNYARFLDYATGRIFLRKVGGGYIFVHRYLLEYFASLPLPGGH